VSILRENCIRFYFQEWNNKALWINLKLFCERHFILVGIIHRVLSPDLFVLLSKINGAFDWAQSVDEVDLLSTNHCVMEEMCFRECCKSY
jgi:uncharacterized protein YbaP (TraB family)